MCIDTQIRSCLLHSFLLNMISRASQRQPYFVLSQRTHFPLVLFFVEIVSLWFSVIVLLLFWHFFPPFWSNHCCCIIIHLSFQLPSISLCLQWFALPCFMLSLPIPEPLTFCFSFFLTLLFVSLSSRLTHGLGCNELSYSWTIWARFVKCSIKLVCLIKQPQAWD